MHHTRVRHLYSNPKITSVLITEEMLFCPVCLYIIKLIRNCTYYYYNTWSLSREGNQEKMSNTVTTIICLVCRWPLQLPCYWQSECWVWNGSPALLWPWCAWRDHAAPCCSIQWTARPGRPGTYPVPILNQGGGQHYQAPAGKVHKLLIWVSFILWVCSMFSKMNFIFLTTYVVW